MGVRRLFVAWQNAREAEEAVGSRDLQVIPVVHAREVLKEVFGDRPLQRLDALLACPESRQTLLDRVFYLVLNGTAMDIKWGAVAEAAARAIRTPGLSKDQGFMAGFASAVALRHAQNEGPEIPLPSDEYLECQPAPVRLALIGHLFQHCADTGAPTMQRAQELADRHLVRGREAFVEHLRALGAWGRLMAVSGRPEKALAAEVEAAEGLYQRFARKEVSRSLSMGLRLAGALKDLGAYKRLDELRERLEREGWLSERDRVFLSLSKGAARVLLGIRDNEAPANLETLYRDQEAPEHVRLSARRFLIRWKQESGDSEGAKVLLGDWRAEAAKQDASLDKRLFFALARLDRDPMDQEALQDLEQLDAGTVGHLCRAAQRLGWSSGARNRVMLSRAAGFRHYRLPKCSQ